MNFFDAHLDLAYIAFIGRDLLADDPTSGDDKLQPGAITLPSMQRGRVRACLATVFTEPAGLEDSGAVDESVCYDPADPLTAYHAGVEQLNFYHRLARDKQIALPSAGLTDGPIAVGILMENADPIASPDDLGWWVERGVVAIGMTWGTPSRYAAGNATPNEKDSGLTDLGVELVQAMDRLGVVHDASHLSDRSLDGLFDATDRCVIASHSNCRSLAGENQRHLTDEAIREIGRRDGVVGLNLYRRFLKPNLGPTERPSIAETIDHVERICDITGSKRHVGLGTDADGGLDANDLPAGIDQPSDYHKLLVELASRGWDDAELEAFAYGNWARMFSSVWTATA